MLEILPDARNITGYKNITGCSKYYRMLEILPDIEILPVDMVPYSRQTDRGLKYLFVVGTGSGSFPLP